MAVCEVCSAEYDYPGQEVDLYQARLVERRASGKSIGGKQVASKYDHFRPVKVTVCKRHRRELTTQRIFPGFLVFILALLPVAFILGKIYPFQGVWLRLLYAIAAAISLGISLVAVRLISLPGLVATAMTIKEKRKGNNFEYITPKKYQGIIHPSPGLLAMARAMVAGKAQKKSITENKKPQKRTAQSKRSR